MPPFLSHYHNTQRQHARARHALDQSHHKMPTEKGDDVPKPVGTAAAPPTDWTALVGMAMAYLVLNVSINTFNKWSLGVYGFHFPLSVTLAHQVFSFVALSAWLKTCDPERERTYKDHWRVQRSGLVFTGIMTALNLGLNNGSLVLISLSANQLITASMPLFTVAFTFLLEPDAFKPHLLQLLVGALAHIHAHLTHTSHTTIHAPRRAAPRLLARLFQAAVHRQYRTKLPKCVTSVEEAAPYYVMSGGMSEWVRVCVNGSAKPS